MMMMMMMMMLIFHDDDIWWWWRWWWWWWWWWYLMMMTWWYTPQFLEGPCDETSFGKNMSFNIVGSSNASLWSCCIHWVALLQVVVIFHPNPCIMNILSVIFIVAWYLNVVVVHVDKFCCFVSIWALKNTPFWRQLVDT